MYINPIKYIHTYPHSGDDSNNQPGVLVILPTGFTERASSFNSSPFW